MKLTEEEKDELDDAYFEGNWYDDEPEQIKRYVKKLQSKITFLLDYKKQSESILLESGFRLGSCMKENSELQSKLAAAIEFIKGIDAEANNIQLDIGRVLRRLEGKQVKP